MKSLLKVIFTRKGLVVLVLVLIVCIASSGLFLGSSEIDAWQDHPFTLGIVTGLITLFISFFILEEWRQEHTNQLWREVAKVAYKDVSRLCREIVRSMQLLYVCVEQLPQDNDYLYLDPWGLDLAKKVNESKRNIDVAILSIESPVMFKNHHRHFAYARCQELCADESWRIWALKQIDMLWSQHCDLVGKWAPLMMESNESREFLNQFSKLDQNFRRIYFSLLDYRDGYEKRLWAEFNLLDLQSRAIYNSLRVAASPDYVGRPDLFKLCYARDTAAKKHLELLGTVEDLEGYCGLLK